MKLLSSERRVKTLLRFFRKFVNKRNTQLNFVCSNMWAPFLNGDCQKKHRRHYSDAAEKFLDNWVTRALQTDLEPMKNVARMLRSQ